MNQSCHSKTIHSFDRWGSLSKKQTSESLCQKFKQPKKSVYGITKNQRYNIIIDGAPESRQGDAGRAPSLRENPNFRRKF